jgi:hypothetical protein
MTRRPRWTVPTAPGLLLAVSLGTVALAQDDGDGSAAPAEDVSGTSVPRGPFVDFCPTPNTHDGDDHHDAERVHQDQ